MPALTLGGLQERGAWGSVALPRFDVPKMVAKTKASARWMHFAPSNLFTGEIAPRAQQLLNEGLMDTGIVGVETWDEEIVSKVLQPHDNLRIRVVMPPNPADERCAMPLLAHIARTLWFMPHASKFHVHVGQCAALRSSQAWQTRWQRRHSGTKSSPTLHNPRFKW